MNDTVTNTNDRAYVNAISHRDRLASKINVLASEIDNLRKELARVDLFIEDWRRFSSDENIVHTQVHESVSIGDKAEAEVRNRSSTTVRRNSKKELVAAVVRNLIEAAGKPLSRDELFPVLIEKGLVIDGTDPQMVLSTMLWRMRDIAKIVRLKGGGYWLGERDYPPSGYSPNVGLHFTEDDILVVSPDAVDDRLPDKIEDSNDD